MSIDCKETSLELMNAKQELRTTQKKFQKACAQLTLLNKRLKELNLRQEKACKEGNRRAGYNLKLRMSVLEGVIGMYYEYVYMRAEDMAMLQHDVKFWKRKNSITSSKACRSGWTGYGNKCYKLVHDPIDRYTAYDKCRIECVNCSMVKILGSSTNSFIADLAQRNSGQCETFWLGMMKSIDGTEYQWDDGSSVDWTNWQKDGETPSGRTCVTMTRECKWKDSPCLGEHRYICQYPKTDQKLCVDQRDDCRDLQKQNPGFCDDYKKTFALTFCPKHCGLC